VLRRSPRSRYLVKGVQEPDGPPEHAKDDTGDHKWWATDDHDGNAADGVPGLPSDSPAKPSPKSLGQEQWHGKRHHDDDHGAEFAEVPVGPTF
jgi:hypothetical protein